jgi:hypothetical protein
MEISSQNLPRRKSYTVEYKLMVIKDYYKMWKENSEETARNFKINGCLVRKWIK